MNRVLNKIKLYAAGFILAACVLVFIACNQPSGPGNPTVYTVTFDKSNEDASGATEANPRTIAVTSPDTTVKSLPTPPTRTAHNFVSWNTMANGSGSPFDENTPVTADIKVYAQWTDKPPSFKVEFNITGEDEGDDVSVSPESAVAGAKVTISYTLASTKINNRLAFTGVAATIASIETTNTNKPGSFEYTIVASDASSGVITINAVFTHTDKQLDTIAFTGNEESKSYGDTFIKTVTNPGAGSGAISYSSGTLSVATVDISTGEVTIKGVGTSVITATKAAAGNYEGTTAEYTLRVAALQLTISGTAVTQTKVYDGEVNAEVTTVGTLDNVVSGDTVTVDATATYNSPNVATADTITVVYTLSGTHAGNYIAPENKEISGTITKASGAAIAVPEEGTISYNYIAVKAITEPSNGQSIEYAVSTSTTTPASGWLSSLFFGALNDGTDYYIYARAIGNANYNEGTVQKSAVIKTLSKPVINPLRSAIVDFEADNLGSTTKYYPTGGNGSATLTIVDDPLNSNQKSLQVNVTGYNRAAVIPINLPYELKYYATVSFRINVKSGDIGNKVVLVYAADGNNTFNNYNFGNNLDTAPNLAGRADNVDFATGGFIDNWTYFSINLSPGATIANLKGLINIAIGFNNSGATYLLDDIVFTLKDDFDPPSEISPKTASFDKNTDYQEDIPVTLTLNGNTFVGVQNGGTNLNSGTDYTVVGNTITLKKEYLVTQPVGTTTLSFVFSAGDDQDIVITVRETPEGGTPMVIKYVFSTDTVTTTFTSVSDTRSTATVKPTTNGGVLEVDVKGSNDLVIIPFNLGATNLTNYTKIKIEIASISGDATWKDLRVFVPNSAGTFVGMGDTTTRIATQGNALTNPNNWNTYTITLSNTSTAYTGAVNLAFGFPSINNNGLVYQIRNIELLP